MKVFFDDATTLTGARARPRLPGVGRRDALRTGRGLESRGTSVPGGPAGRFPSNTSRPARRGMLAVYRPLVQGHAGTLKDPIPWASGMDVDEGKYYSFSGKTYLAKADMKPCVWPPGTSGLWQWELVETA